MKNKEIVIILGITLLILVGSYGKSNNMENFVLLRDKAKGPNTYMFVTCNHGR